MDKPTSLSEAIKQTKKVLQIKEELENDEKGDELKNQIAELRDQAIPDPGNVKEMADQFSSLTASTYDIVAKLKIVSENALNFVRIASPVGAFIATAANIAFEVLIAAHCNEFSYTGETSEIENRKIGLLLKETAAHVADWISTRLAMTWPTISSAYAKTIAKGKSPIVESKEEYERVEKALKLVLDEMGEAKYKHTVIVFPHWTDERQVATICPSTFCFT
uniref:Uncharacterized protein n=1 Tax=Globodera rostochiensis TaxID=31243 RepID=A0A914HTY8_GLORO